MVELNTDTETDNYDYYSVLISLNALRPGWP